ICFTIETRTPRSTLFPYTTLFRSQSGRGRGEASEGRLRFGRALRARGREGRQGRAGRLRPARLVARKAHARARRDPRVAAGDRRSEEHTSELQSRENLVCRLLLEK